ncbi:DUF262 domain-containing protein [Bacillus velezensis]|uniref:DUF262 domain-containing protein n=1 Tax=Bacillus velezensis TaxID=492670 RepID=UPI002DB80D4E|nr:DUF262 domain-containing protein [Bacillus velezensis]MEC3772817.1 DUF262 domain-containing protein [Bacillus velezensis]
MERDVNSYEPELEFEQKEEELINASREEDLQAVYPNADIKVERDQYPIFQLYRKYDKQQIILDPDFQREDVWGQKQKSELIETVLMGIPLPVFYLNERKDGKLVVVDGRQRLTTFFGYLNDEFKLSNLRILSKLNDKKFSDLEPILQANLEDFQIIAQVIKPPTPDRIKFDIFDRVNRGGTPLNNQEMRNALYQGKATKLLKLIAASEEFKLATVKSIKPSRMKDRYLILRTVAFYLWNNDLLKDANGKVILYKNDIDEFLGKTMEFLNRCSDKEIEDIKNSFLTSLRNNYVVMKENAFRRLQINGRRQPINMILFEALTIFMWGYSQEYCIENKDLFYNIIYQFLSNDEMNRLLTVDRGRGLVVPKILTMINEMKEGFADA